MILSLTTHKSLASIIVISLLFSGCAGSSSKLVEDKYYSHYDCQELFKTMEYKVGQANLLYTNYEDEDGVDKVTGGALMTAAGVGLASALILTPLGWVLAGGLMLGGTGEMLDGLSAEELSDSEKLILRKYQSEYNDMKKLAIEKKCDYYSIPKWDVSPESSARAVKKLSKDISEDG